MPTTTTGAPTTTNSATFIFAAVELNNEPVDAVDQAFNANIAFSNGMSNSYWVDAWWGGDYSAEIRTH